MANLSDYLDKELWVVIGNTILSYSLWADDRILISDSIHRLRKQLKGLNKFCSKNQILVNFIKTKLIWFIMSNQCGI